jgi:hypothetical protein
MEVLAEKKTDKSMDEIESAMDAGESKWQFEICDTLTNTGPILDFDIGQRASNVSDPPLLPSGVPFSPPGQKAFLILTLVDEFLDIL